MRRMLAQNRVYANSVATVDSSIHLADSTSSLSLPAQAQLTFKRRSPKSGNAVTKSLKAIFGRGSKKAKKTRKEDIPLLPVSAGSTSTPSAQTRHRRRASALPRPVSPALPLSRAAKPKAKSKKSKGPSKRQLQQLRLEELAGRARRGEKLDAAEDWELKDLTLKLIGGI